MTRRATFTQAELARHPAAPAFYAHNGLWFLESGEGFAATCKRCGRDISAPHRFQRCTIWCLYCGMEAGHVPMVELSGGTEFWHGINPEECTEVRAVLGRRGDLEAWALDRDRQFGRVWEIGT